MKGTDEKIAQNESDSSIKRLEFLLGQALDEDEEGNIESALQLYMEAIETGLEIVRIWNLLTFFGNTFEFFVVERQI